MNQELKDLGVVEGGGEFEHIQEIPLPETPEERLKFTQSVRMRMAQAQMPGGKVPTDKDSVQALLATLKDMDAQELGIMRQKTDDNNSRKDQIVAAALLELAQRQGSGSVMRVEGSPVQRAAIPLDSELPEFEVVPGELDTGSHTITYADMHSRFSRDKGNLIEHDPT